jgi:choloylglycine hydrolase
MCTAITLSSKSKEQFFGRTMDFSFDIIPQFFIIPSSYVWRSTLNQRLITNTYRFIGLGQKLEGLLGFFDGVNEKGFAAAVLYFADYAKYEDASVHRNKDAIASIDFLHFILGKCSSVESLPDVLKNIAVVGIEDPITHSVAPLHWIATDRSGACVVIEATGNGIEIINNPIGVMANSPDFRWHMTNLRNYMETSPTQRKKANWDDVTLAPFGQAGGTRLLPGGFTSPERFVRAAYLKSHIQTPEDNMEAITACFHIMESVSIPKGAVITSRNTYDYTKYTAFINTNTCQYYYKDYDDLGIRSVSLWDGAEGERV